MTSAYSDGQFLLTQFLHYQYCVRGCCNGQRFRYAIESIQEIRF
jgi:hypothetical protein